MNEQERLDEAKEEIKRRVKCTDFLTKAKKSGYVCPVCGSGSHGEGTGAVKYYEQTNTWACHACEKETGKKMGGDVIRLYQETYGVNYTEALKQLAKVAGVDVETPLRELAKAKGKETPLMNTGAISIPAVKINIPGNYESYYAECRERLPMAAEYLASRGISMETAAAYGLGFDPKADTAESGHPCPRLIIPVNSGHYVARRTDGGQDCKKLNPKGSKPGIFNADVLKGDSTEIFVTEGALDALSVIEAGAAAVGLNSTANAGELVKLLEAKPKAAFILCLDNDTAGQKTTETLRQGLTRLNIPFAVADICGEAKDPNEALTKDKALFLSAIERAKKLVTTKPDNTSLYIDVLMGADLEKFKEDIPTGFVNLDMQAGGGLYPGLYVLAAISSLGKTTLALQMGEQIAKAGRDVIYFSLEQSRFEMVSKGLARRTAMADLNTAVNSLSIRKGFLPERVLRAAEQYKSDVGDRLSIVEGNFSCDISYIADYIRQYVEHNGVRPVVFVDYLQILQPTETRQGTKETVDLAMTELKRLSREINIPIVAISSINRANYLTPVDFESLKESGGIEYTADCIWGLQLQILRDEKFHAFKASEVIKKRELVKEAKKANPRKIELVCLKNRYGISSYSCFFDYYPAYDYFTDCKEFDFVEVHETPKAGKTI